MGAAAPLSQNRLPDVQEAERRSLLDTLHGLPPVAIAALLFLLSLPLHLLGLGDMEFFRHTEADRTLIAWEMLSRGDYVVPHLLGSPILTKPPLFYWLIAFSLGLTGEINEWAARLPSALSASLFSAVQFLVVFKATRSSAIALLSAIILTTGVHFLTLAGIAEIDMVFGLLCASTLYSLYFLMNAPSPWGAVATGVLAALAFLTKGPPVIFFTGATFFGFAATCWLRDRRPLLRIVGCVLLAGGIFSFIVGAWAYVLADRVGVAPLLRQWDVEIFQRIVSSSQHSRGPHFYLWSALIGLLPWSLLLIGLRPGILKEKDPFMTFNGLTVLLALAMLSFAAGKSSRYLFPIYPFIANIITWCALRSTPQLWLLYRIGALLGAVGVIFSLGTPFLPPLDGVPRSHIFFSAAIVFGLSVALFHFCRRRQSLPVVIVLILAMVGFRSIEKMIYVPHRNVTRSVRTLTYSIHNSIPAGAPLFTVEMFERWIVFYLKQLGREVNRLTPDHIAKLPADEPVYLLLNTNEESWRIPQLRYRTADVHVVANLDTRQDHFLVVRVRARHLRALGTSEDYPTVPSIPFAREYGESGAR